MVSMTVEIKTSRAIAAQILRHRSFSFQEFSQRYSEAVEVCDVELRKQAETNRQSSSEVFDPMIKESGWFDAKLQPASDIIEDHFVDSLALYQRLINEGVAKESARMVLPLATETTMYMSGTLRSWLHYVELRTMEDTQKEHREIALGCKDILKEHFPTIIESLDL
jgi:thymidylate synthase (FAD)